ncbi:MAG: hypothetical protein WDO70_11815 [Alphaproteobacteria bacterium]
MKKDRKKKSRKEEEDADAWRDRLLMGLILMLLVVGLCMLFSFNTPERPLECSGPGGSLLAFGSCKER